MQLVGGRPYVNVSPFDAGAAVEELADDVAVVTCSGHMKGRRAILNNSVSRRVVWVRCREGGAGIKRAVGAMHLGFGIGRGAARQEDLHYVCVSVESRDVQRGLPLRGVAAIETTQRRARSGMRLGAMWARAAVHRSWAGLHTALELASPVVG